MIEGADSVIVALDVEDEVARDEPVRAQPKARAGTDSVVETSPPLLTSETEWKYGPTAAERYGRTDDERASDGGDMLAPKSSGMMAFVRTKPVLTVSSAFIMPTPISTATCGRTQCLNTSEPSSPVVCVWMCVADVVASRAPVKPKSAMMAERPRRLRVSTPRRCALAAAGTASATRRTEVENRMGDR